MKLEDLRKVEQLSQSYGKLKLLLKDAAEFQSHKDAEYCFGGFSCSDALAHLDYKALVPLLIPMLEKRLKIYEKKLIDLGVELT